MHDVSLIRHLHKNTQEIAIATCQGLQVNYRTDHLLQWAGGKLFPKAKETLLPCIASEWQLIRDASTESGLRWPGRVLRAVAAVPARSLLNIWDVSCLTTFHLVSKQAHNALFPTLQPRREEGEKEPSVQDRGRLYLVQFDPILSNLGNKELRVRWGWGRRAHLPVCPTLP